jgi:Ala-tRNA(Pro) deacylase
MAATEAELCDLLRGEGIAFTRHAHPPLHTVAESRALRGELPGVHVKNMFLKDRKGALVLVTCREDRRIRIGDLEKRLGTARLSFADAETLWRHLGVRPGAVTPLALLNDREARAVRLVLDAQMLRDSPVNVHPLHNEATVAIPTAGLLRFFEVTGHRPELLDFDALEALVPPAG